MIKNCDRRDFIMCASSNAFWAEGEKATEDIVLGHAYSLLAVNEFEHKGKTVKLVKLRNPWGYREWKGAWSDGSS